MKLVDILFVLTAAATANAILIPTDNNGSPQASGTSSQMSGPTDEPNPNTLDDLQSIVDAVNLSIFDEDWKYLFDSTDPSTSDQDWQQPIDQPSSDTSSQVSGTTDKPDSNTSDQDQQQSIDVVDPSTSRRAQKRPIDEPGSNISKYDQKQSMDQPGPSASKQSRKQSTNEPGLVFPDKNWQRLIDEVNSDAFEEWQELFDIAGLNTPSQVSDPIDQVDSNTFDKDQQQPADQPSSSISDQTQQHPIDATDLNIPNKDPQQPIDQSSPSTSSQGRKRPIDETSQNTCSQAPGSTNEPNPSTSDEYWKPLFDIINPNIPSQDPIDVAGPSTSSQDQQQPMDQGESANTVTNQVIVLSERYQRTFNRIKQRLELSEIIQNNKRKECREYAALKFEQWSALSMGEDISGSKYDPKVEKQLKEEYKKISRRVHDVKYELKRFMKRRGLKLEEPN